MPALETTYFKKGDGQLQIKLRDSETENQKLKEALMKNGDDYKDLLKDMEKYKLLIKEKNQQIDLMEIEMKAKPSLHSINAS